MNIFSVELLGEEISKWNEEDVFVIDKTYLCCLNEK